MKLILVILLTFNCLAGGIQQIIKGEPAPYSGYVITYKFERDLRTKKENLERRNLLLSDLSVVKEKRIGFYQKSSEDAYKELRKQRIKTTVYTLGGFVIGVSLSAIAIMSMKKVIE